MVCCLVLLVEQKMWGEFDIISLFSIIGKIFKFNFNKIYGEYYL
jgi:hypothetical protein